MHLTFAEIRQRGVRLSAAEAVALVLAAARESEQGQNGAEPAALPGPDEILLSDSGRVWFSRAGAHATERERLQSLAALLRSLLALDDRTDSERGAPAPGALVVLIARALGQIDLPAPPYSAFREALGRFGSADAVTLASVYRRVSGTRNRGAAAAPGSGRPRPRVVPLPARVPEPPRIIPNRRRQGPTVAFLRRELRQTELQLFAALQQNGRTWFGRMSQASGRAAAALVMAAVGFAIALGLNEKAAAPIAPDVVEIASASGDESATAARNEEAGAARVARVEPRVPDERRPPAVPDAGSTDFSARVRAVSSRPLLAAGVVGADLFSPSFAGDGRQLLFHAGRDRAALMRASFDEHGQPAVATIVEDGAANYHASLSPDGEWLAFDTDREGIRAVFVARADGTEARRVSGDGYAAVPTWSPDGRQLAFIKSERDRPRVWNLWVADLAARTLSRVSRHRVGQAWGGSWFPDGKRLAYSVEDRLVIASLHDGTIRVVRSPRAGRLVRTPAVSPDGRWILFQVYRDGVWLLDVSTGGMRRVLGDRAAEEFAWSPDSRRVVYHTKRKGAWSLWQLELNHGQGTA